MMPSDSTILAVLRERAYQDNKWGTPWGNPHTIRQWLTIMQRELTEAKRQHPGDDQAILQEVVQVVAVGIACLEQHGLGSKR